MAADLQYVTFEEAIIEIKNPHDSGSYAEFQVDGSVRVGFALEKASLRVPSLSHFPIGDRVRAKDLTVEAVLKDVRTADLALAFAGSTESSGTITLDNGQLVYVGVKVTINLNPNNTSASTLVIEAEYAACTSDGDTELADSEEGHGFPMRFEARKIATGTEVATMILS